MKAKYIPVFLVVFVLALSGGIRGRTEQSTIPGDTLAETGVREESTIGTEAVAEAELLVYVCGRVEHPGVYTLPANARIMDAVDAAGGFLEDADPEYWNLAERLTDGEQIRVPSQEESATMEARSAGEETSGGRVNLNTADEAALMTLTGIGASRARAIISYREENGPFRSIEDIMNVSGIKEASFAKIKDFITVG